MGLFSFDNVSGFIDFNCLTDYFIHFELPSQYSFGNTPRDRIISRSGLATRVKLRIKIFLSRRGNAFYLFKPSLGPLPAVFIHILPVYRQDLVHDLRFVWNIFLDFGLQLNRLIEWNG